eukprot:s1264_g24.t1
MLGPAMFGANDGAVTGDQCDPQNEDVIVLASHVKSGSAQFSHLCLAKAAQVAKQPASFALSCYGPTGIIQIESEHRCTPYYSDLKHALTCGALVSLGSLTSLSNVMLWYASLAWAAAAFRPKESAHCLSWNSEATFLRIEGDSPAPLLCRQAVVPDGFRWGYQAGNGTFISVVGKKGPKE